MKNLQQNHQTQDALSDQWGQEFANSWLVAWNSHDVDQILDYYADDLVMLSPVVNEMTGSSEGVRLDKPGLRNMCARIFQEIPELQFSLSAVAVGINSLTIHYTSSECDMVADVMKFDDRWKITKSHTYY